MTDRTAIQKAMAKLSNPHRAMIYRAYYLNRTTAQIAAELLISEDAVRCRMHDAMRELRRLLVEVHVAG